MSFRLRPIAVMAVIWVLMLAVSGQWTDPWLLAFLGVWTLLMAVAVTLISEDLARERFAPPEPGADRVPLHFIRLAALSHLVLGALDAGRWHLFPVPTSLRLIGFAGYALFGALAFRAMLANRFFSAVVRIQGDRGHYVVDQGPYAIVRHPGYAGMMLAVPCSALALGSWLAVVCALAFSAMILRRVKFEDAFLQANLRGYRDYLTRVPYKLLPGVW
jgi:protein-S-isoprenylcysteine O-methyltransferase Ste14